MIQLSDKKYIAKFIDNLYKQGLRKVVISPGSRNSSLIISFINYGKFDCYTIVDERSAGFIALGMAQQLNEPVALVCTSGSAPLNYSPAIVEAFYQQIPLLVLTADRPAEMINIGESQTIDQTGIYSNYIRGEFSVARYMDHSNEHWINNFMTEIFDKCNGQVKGPVHINLPLREPLYKVCDFVTDFQNKTDFAEIGKTNGIDYSIYEKKISSAKKILILPGFMQPNQKLLILLDLFQHKTSSVVLAEHTSNLRSINVIQSMDNLLTLMDSPKNYVPDLLITFGNQLVSRKIKEFIRNNPPTEHWHIDLENKFDTFQCLTDHLKSSPENFFSKILTLLTESNDNSYYRQFTKLNESLKVKHAEFLNNTEWSDLKVFETILDKIPKSSTLHLANSTPVRYAQIFELPVGTKVYCNRGVSGIDGSTSTAIGASMVNKKENIFITGDISFLYDSNALWNKYKPKNLKIFLINNGGGNIFRFIPGPLESGCLEEYFETPHDVDIEALTKAYKVSHRQLKGLVELEEYLNNEFKIQKFEIVEIITPRFKNSEILKEYFHYLSSK